MSEKFPSQPPESRHDSNRPTIPVPKNPFESKEQQSFKISTASFEKFNRYPGAKERNNEDAWMVMEDADGRGCTAMIADGMGGYPGADRAARSVVQTAANENAKLTAQRGIEDTFNNVRSILREANARLVLERSTLPEEESHLERMGTTGVLARVIELPDGKREAVIGHAGDSRAWIRYADGHLECQTLDMHPVFRLIRHRAGGGFADAIHTQSIVDNLESYEQFEFLLELLEGETPWPEKAAVTKDEIDFLATVVGEPLMKFYFNQRATVDGAFGYNPQIDVIRAPLPPGATLLLTTDGIHDNLMRYEMEALLRGERGTMDEDVWVASRTGQDPANILAKAAYSRSLDFTHSRSKGADDITAVVIETPKR
jgi:serine/threonine protein phosphatase PrpC